MALSAVDLKKLQRRFGAAFTDAELEEIYADAGDNWNKTMFELYDTLVANAAKLADYTAGASSEKRQQVFANLLKLRDTYRAEVAEDAKQARGQVKLISATHVPPNRKRKPRGF